MTLTNSIEFLRRNKPGKLSSLILATGLGWLVFADALVDIAGLKIPYQCSAEEAAKATVEFNALDKTTTYRIASGECTIEWIARDSEKGVVKHGSRCAEPLALQLPLMTKICAEFSGMM